MRIFKRIMINTIASNHLVPGRIRVKLYQLMGLKIKADEVRSRCFFNSEYVTIGKDSFINHYCQFHSAFTPKGYIKIGERCFVGMNVNFCTISHEIGDEKQRAGKNIYDSITIEDGVWIGANSVILQGVTIGKGCVITAGAVINKDCEPNGMYAGVPARRIRDLG